MPSSWRRPSARASKLPRIELSPQWISETSMLTSAIQQTAPRPVFGKPAIRSMSRAAGGELATT
jgi:hypothetical protein